MVSYSTKNRQHGMAKYKSSGKKEGKNSGYKGPKGPSITRISIIPIIICIQVFLATEMQLQT